MRVVRTSVVWLFLLFTVAGIAPGCNRSTSDRDLRFVDAAEAQRTIAGSGGVLGIGGHRAGVWVDPRPAAAYAAGHIPGSINIPLADVRDRYRELDDYPSVIVYGEEPNSVIASSMSKTLQQLGIKEVSILRGGLRAWRSANLPVDVGVN